MNCFNSLRVVISLISKAILIECYIKDDVRSTMYHLSLWVPDEIVFGKDPSKLNLFSFAAERYFIDDIPKDMEFDHAFECVGNQGSSIAINDVIKYIRPQGSLMLMGVSELPVAVNTRNVLEKGMTLVGCSRSGRDDFLKATEIMADTDTQNRLSVITTLYGSVRSIKDIHSVFVADLNNPFKTVFKWEM